MDCFVASAPRNDVGATSGATAPARPLDPSKRIDAIDVLRGLALFGVMAINITAGFRVSIFQQFIPKTVLLSPLDRIVDTILTLAIDLKAFALFSLLFGAGLAIQFERLARDPRRTVLLLRRLIVLLAFGLIHLCLIWNGDILTEYALAGLVVLPFLFGPRALLGLAAVAFLILYLALQIWMPGWVWPGTGVLARDVAEANRIYATGSIAEISAFRLRELPLVIPLHAYIFARTIGLFLLGAFAWRKGLLRGTSASQPVLFAVAAIGIAFGAVMILCHAGALIRGYYPNVLAVPLGTVLLATGYGAAIIAIANLASGKRLLGWASPLGRMAFTNYLMQSVIFGFVFYSYGIGLFGQIGVTSALAIGIAVYVAQVFFSKWWLVRFRYGPVEWLWRTLMYGVPQPMRLGA